MMSFYFPYLFYYLLTNAMIILLYCVFFSTCCCFPLISTFCISCWYSLSACPFSGLLTFNFSFISPFSSTPFITRSFLASFYLSFLSVVITEIFGFILYCLYMYFLCSSIISVIYHCCIICLGSYIIYLFYGLSLLYFVPLDNLLLVLESATDVFTPFLVTGLTS